MSTTGKSILSMMATYPEPFVIAPTSTHTHSFILLHGRAGSGIGFARDFLQATDSAGNTLPHLIPGMRFIFPTATKRVCPELEGYPLNAWFDYDSRVHPNEHSDIQVRGLRESSLFVHQLLDKEIQAVGSGKVFLGGVSQGGAMALYAHMTYRSSAGGILGGVVGISGWLPMQKELNAFAIAAKEVDNKFPQSREAHHKVPPVPRNQALALDLSRRLIHLPESNVTATQDPYPPILLLHGKADNEVPLDVAIDALITLAQMALNVNLKKYEGLGHSWRNGDEIDEIARFLRGESQYVAEYDSE